MFGNTRETERVVRETVEKIIKDAMGDAQNALRMTGDLTKLRQELETVKIEKARKDEEFARRERDIEHKVGLERKRQEFEVAQAKRESTVAVREENLKADKDRFAEQLKFHEDRFSTEVGYLKDILKEMMGRLPTADIKMTKRG